MSLVCHRFVFLEAQQNFQGEFGANANIIFEITHQHLLYKISALLGRDKRKKTGLG